jgi:hypothetical protein
MNEDARGSAATTASGGAAAAVGSLPDDVLLRIFALLPVDVRARCACVRRGWRATLDSPSAWTRLDLSATTGGTACTVGDAALLAAAAKARGGLQALDVTGCASLSRHALRAVFAANAASLRTARVRGAWADKAACMDAEDVAELLASAHALTALHADVCCSLAEAPALLLGAPPYDSLRLARLRVDDSCLVTRSLHQGHDAALVAWLANDGTGPVAEPAHEAALQAAAAAVFEPPADVPAALACAAALAAALPANGSVTTLSLSTWRGALAFVGGAAASVLRALAAHGSLTALEVHAPQAERAHEAAAALGALLGANAPALRELRFDTERLREAHLRPLCAALPRNTHLRSLEWRAAAVRGGSVSEAFAASELLPAVQQNASLRRLHVGHAAAPQPPSARQAEALVQARAADA